jgi:hypothetical protein
VILAARRGDVHVSVMPIRASLVFLWLPALTLALSGTAFGQAGGLQQRLARTTGLDCTFSAMAAGSWEAGTAAVKLAPTNLHVTFTGIDADDATAYVAGSVGTSPVVARFSNYYLHLMQMHSAGHVYMTTVLAKETKNGRMMAVHTRHEYADVSVPGLTSTPETYFGDCALVP